MASGTPLKVLAQVIRVVDGDTIVVSIDGEEQKLRYIGIDCPEKPGEWMASEAREANKKLVEGKTVYLEKDVSHTDRYGRLLRYVWVDEKMVNAELVRLGYAHSSAYPPDVKYQDQLIESQKEAREAGRGLWGDPPTDTPTPVVEPTAASAVADVRIEHIFYDGAVPRVESDEYCEIVNRRGAAVNLKGWRLNAGDPGQDFLFPDFVLQPGETCRVYTNEYHPESGGLSFGYGKAIWNNGGDCGYLYDASGREVSRHCYGK